MNDDLSSNHTALLQRASLLLEQGRYTDAAEWLQQALAIDPNDAQTLSSLAICWAQEPATQERAVEAARQAIALNPETGHYHSVLAITLIRLAKPGQDKLTLEAKTAAMKALELDPDDAHAHAVLGLTQLQLHQYPAAELSARQALSLNTGDTLATQVLSMALLNQRKDEDLQSLVDWQLMENPEEDSAHVSAGYQALYKGDHKKACLHFREALRIDPDNGGARDGLIESFRARSAFYRLFLKFNHFMRRFGKNGSTSIMIGGYVLYRFAYASLVGTYPVIAYLLAGAWMILAFWTFLARGLGSAMMLTDRFVRQAIQPKERWEGVAVGGMVLLALIFLLAGLILGRLSLVMSALACFFASVPIASAFFNAHHIGKWVDLFMAVVCGGAALIFSLLVVLHIQISSPLLLFQAAVYGGVAVSWMRALRILTR